MLSHIEGYNMIFPSRSFASAFFASAAPPVEESDPPRAARDDFAASPFAATPPPRPPLARPNHPLFLESSSTLAVRVATSFYERMSGWS